MLALILPQTNCAAQEWVASMGQVQESLGWLGTELHCSEELRRECLCLFQLKELTPPAQPAPAGTSGHAVLPPVSPQASRLPSPRGTQGVCGQRRDEAGIMHICLCLLSKALLCGY